MDKSSFVDMAVQDLFGKAPKVQESAREHSPAKSSFVDVAVADLKGGAAVNVTENTDKLRDAFAKSFVGGNASDKPSTKIVEEVKKVADNEVKETLAKLLRGIK